MLINIFLIFTFFIINCSIYAEIVSSSKIIEISTSGQSFMINKGLRHGITKGDLAIFYIPQKKNKFIKTYVMREFARGKALRVKEDKSYWYLSRILESRAIKLNRRINYITESQILRGRVKSKTQYSNVVLTTDQDTKIYNDLRNEGVARKTIRKAHQFRKDNRVIVTDSEKEKKIDVILYRSWKIGMPQKVHNLGKTVETRFFDEVKESRSNPQIVSKEEEEIFYSASKSSMDTYNDQQLLGVRADDGLASQMNNASMQRLKNKDLRWSSGLTDKELRRFFVDSGTARERKRQKFTLQNSLAIEFIFKYGSGTVKHVDADEFGQKDTTKFWGIGFEYHLLRLSENLRRWTIDFYFEKAVGNYTIDEIKSDEGILISTQEKYYKLGINYYFYRYPSSLYNLTAYIGTRIGFGKIQANYIEYGEYDSYSATVFPQIHVGFKYRFKAGDENGKSELGFGLNTTLAYEFTQFKLDQKKTDDSSGTFDISDLKLSVGLGVFF